jgi:protein tyrosine phosphatase (PTP) superfamily phosphohydrolase (DUF442 family)
LMNFNVQRASSASTNPVLARCRSGTARSVELARMSRLPR